MSDIEESLFLQRSRMDIIACILEHSAGHSRKTNLIYKCNLGSNQFKVYLSLLLGTGLLRRYEEKGGRVESYEATEKGEAFLNEYRKLKALLEPGEV